MDLVVDANVLFAVLIKEGFTDKLLFNGKFHLFTPEFIFTEFEKHKEEILEKTHRTDEEFFKVLEVLKRRVTLVPLEELESYVEEAERISPDPDDMAYFALAFSLNCPIWTNDKTLKEQDVVKVYHTHELKDILEPRLRPEFIEKMKKRQEEPTVKVKDFEKHFDSDG